MARRINEKYRTKYIYVKYHHEKDVVKDGIFVFKKVATCDQVADCLTKVTVGHGSGPY